MPVAALGMLICSELSSLHCSELSDILSHQYILRGEETQNEAPHREFSSRNLFLSHSFLRYDMALSSLQLKSTLYIYVLPPLQWTWMIRYAVTYGETFSAQNMVPTFRRSWVHRHGTSHKPRTESDMTWTVLAPYKHNVFREEIVATFWSRKTAWRSFGNYFSHGWKPSVVSLLMSTDCI